MLESTLSSAQVLKLGETVGTRVRSEPAVFLAVRMLLPRPLLRLAPLFLATLPTSALFTVKGIGGLPCQQCVAACLADDLDAGSGEASSGDPPPWPPQPPPLPPPPPQSQQQDEGDGPSRVAPFFVGLITGGVLAGAMGGGWPSPTAHRSVQTGPSGGLSTSTQTVAATLALPPARLPRLPSTLVSRAIQTLPPPARYSAGAQTRGVAVTHASVQAWGPAPVSRASQAEAAPTGAGGPRAQISAQTQATVPSRVMWAQTERVAAHDFNG